jgi:hypothetical protein
MQHPMQPFLCWSPFGLLPLLFCSWAAPLLRDDFEKSRPVSRSMPERARSEMAEIIDLETYRQRRSNKHRITRPSFGTEVPRRDR